jgi:hypothetical protein
MTQEELYQHLSKRLSPIEYELTPEGRTTLDGILWAISQELSKENTLQSTGKVVQER